MRMLWSQSASWCVSQGVFGSAARVLCTANYLTRVNGLSCCLGQVYTSTNAYSFIWSLCSERVVVTQRLQEWYYTLPLPLPQYTRTPLHLKLSIKNRIRRLQSPPRPTPSYIWEKSGSKTKIVFGDFSGSSCISSTIILWFTSFQKKKKYLP